MVMDRVNLVCPRCKQELTSRGSELSCASCGEAWRIRDDIPTFTDDDFYWGEISQDLIQKINARALLAGWTVALRELLKPAYPDIYRFVIDEGRADWRFLIPIGRSSVVLDVGSGWGTLSFLLAQACAHVVSVEPVAERAQFIRIRCCQDGQTNLQLLRASLMELPLPESTFDLVVLNGVLEWLGLSEIEENPRNVQMTGLKCVHDMLKPGGYVYIGIENRFGFNLLLGGRDHNGLRFTSLMPRWLANFYTRLRIDARIRHDRSMNSYRTYTYSYKGYQRLLEQVGFTDVRMFSVWPTYNRPAFLIDIQDQTGFLYAVDNLFNQGKFHYRVLRRGSRVLAAVNLQRLLAPCFSIFAKKA